MSNEGHINLTVATLIVTEYYFKRNKGENNYGKI